VVTGEKLSGEELDEQVRSNLLQIGLCLYDFYHLATHEAGLLEAVRITDVAADWLSRSGTEPIVFAAPHISNFDLAGRAMALSGLRAQVLSVPAPTDAYEVQNESRRAAGLDMTPISVASLRKAAERLENGGSVLTGVDRPLPNGKHPLQFFGRPALLPDVHVRLAERFSAPLVFIWAQSRPGGYEIDARLVELQPPSGPAGTVANAERVLSVVEGVIAERPTEWAMPHVVWPDALAELTALETDRS
jgi:KDO2-lipid IV(A) lauroyltransferase